MLFPLLLTLITQSSIDAEKRNDWEMKRECKWEMCGKTESEGSKKNGTIFSFQHPFLQPKSFESSGTHGPASSHGNRPSIFKSGNAMRKAAPHRSSSLTMDLSSGIESFHRMM